MRFKDEAENEHRMKRQLYTFLLASGAWVAQAQDIHFSQFYHAPLQLNPAQTGLFNGEYRVMGNARSQWFSVPVSYNTFKVAFDARLLPEKLEKDVLGAGVMVYYDQAGDSRLSTLYAVGNLAFSKRIGTRSFLGAGLHLGYAQRRFELGNLTFDDQFNGDVFDPTIQSGDLANFPTTTLGYFDIGAGINYRYQKSRRLNFDIGAALQHITAPQQSFNGTGAVMPRLSRKWIQHFSGSFPIHQRWDIMPHALWQMQLPYYEILLGSNFRYHLNESPGRELALFFGATYRWQDALIPVVGISHQSWQLGISYDINISKFVPATSNNGGIELSFMYIWRRVPKLPTIKICPIL